MILFNRTRQLDFPSLRGLETEMAELETANDKLSQRQSELNYLAQRDAMKAGETISIEEMISLSRTRAKLKAESESIDAQLLRNNYRLEECKSEWTQLSQYLNSTCCARERLFRQLGEAHSDEQLLAIRTELLPILRTLARATGDKKATAEYEKMEREHMASLPYVTLKRGYCWTSRSADRKLVVETDLRARVTAYGRGVQVDRAEAEKVGLLAMEAQA